MTIAEAHFEFQMRVNKSHTLGNANFFSYEIDSYLNKAQRKLLTDFYNPNGMGFEDNSFNIAALANVTVTSPELQSVLLPVEVSTGKYMVNLGDLAYEFAFPTRVVCKIKSNNCVKTVNNIKLFRTDTRKNKLNQPNFQYSKVNISFGKSTDSSGLVRFTALYLDATDTKETKQFDITEVYISYVKVPKRVWLGDYDVTTDLKTLTPSNKIYKTGVDSPVDFELSDIFHDQIVEIAANMAAMDLARMAQKAQD